MRLFKLDASPGEVPAAAASSVCVVPALNVLEERLSGLVVLVLVRRPIWSRYPHLRLSSEEIPGDVHVVVPSLAVVTEVVCPVPEALRHQPGCGPTSACEIVRRDFRAHHVLRTRNGAEVFLVVVPRGRLACVDGPGWPNLRCDRP